jgi:hypothetical protein
LGSAATCRQQQEMKLRQEKVMKKVSLIGLVLGSIVGVTVGLLAGKWLFWLGLGLAIGLVVGTARGRRRHPQRGSLKTGNWKQAV